MEIHEIVYFQERESKNKSPLKVKLLNGIVYLFYVARNIYIIYTIFANHFFFNLF